MRSRNSDVCLLYSELDEHIANLLEDALRYYSIDVWKTQNIAIGNKIISETTQVLEKAKFIIVLWSSNSVKSALLKELASQAKQAKKVLIPVLIEKVKIPSEFIDIQPANLVGWNGDRENEQIVKLWRILQEKVLRLQKKRLRLNQLIAILSLIGTFIGAIFTITTPELRCLLKLQCLPKDVSSKDTSTPAEMASASPLKTASPPETILSSPSQATSFSPSPSPSSSVSASTSEFAIVNNDEGFTIRLLGCRQESQTIRCNLKVTSTQTDSPLRIHGSLGSNYQTRIIDISGNEYIADKAELASNEGRGYAESDLIKNVSVNAAVIFDKIPLKINQIAVLEVSCYNQTADKSFKARFSNITLSE